MEAAWIACSTHRWLTMRCILDPCSKNLRIYALWLLCSAWSCSRVALSNWRYRIDDHSPTYQRSQRLWQWTAEPAQCLHSQAWRAAPCISRLEWPVLSRSENTGELLESWRYYSLHWIILARVTLMRCPVDSGGRRICTCCGGGTAAGVSADLGHDSEASIAGSFSVFLNL